MIKDQIRRLVNAERREDAMTAVRSAVAGGVVRVDNAEIDVAAVVTRAAEPPQVVRRTGNCSAGR